MEATEEREDMLDAFEMWLSGYGHGRKSGGGGGTGGRVPPRFFRWGTHYQMSPPPPRFWGRMKIDIINVPFCVIYIFSRFFFFFFACQKCLWCGKGTPTNFDLRDFRRRWRSEKKVSSDLRPWLWRRMARITWEMKRNGSELQTNWSWKRITKNIRK